MATGKAEQYQGSFSKQEERGDGYWRRRPTESATGIMSDHSGGGESEVRRHGDSRCRQGSQELCEERDLITAGRRGRQEGTLTVP